ncbi:MAG: thioredoxin [Clostridiales bacterium]|nr:thioredoxin [Clostridiales bacterium]
MGEIQVLNDNNYNDVTGSGVVVVDFYADWCGPCKMMAPIFEEAKEAYAGRAVFAKINVDENKGIAIDNKIMSIPTLLFFKDGQIADRVSGVLDKATLYGKIDSLL